MLKLKFGSYETFTECGDRECTVEEVDYSILTLFPNFKAKVTFKPVVVTCAAALFYSCDYFDNMVQLRYIFYSNVLQILDQCKQFYLFY